MGSQACLYPPFDNLLSIVAETNETKRLCIRKECIRIMSIIFEIAKKLSPRCPSAWPPADALERVVFNKSEVRCTPSVLYVYGE